MRDLVEDVVKRALSPSNRNRLKPSAVKAIPKLAETWGYGNCWGTTLYMLGVIKEPRFIDSAEMDPWLDKNTKRVVKPAFGDVLVIRRETTDCSCIYDSAPYNCGGRSEYCDAPGALMHTAVYIGDGLYWHQRGHCGQFLIESLLDIVITYPGDHYHARRKARLTPIRGISK